MKYATLLLMAVLLTSCKASQVLTTDTVTTDSLNRQQLERWYQLTISQDGRSATVHELETRTDLKRKQTRHETQAPAPATPWYDRWAHWIAGIVVVLLAGWTYLKFFSPLRF